MDLQRAMNAVLPGDISIRGLVAAERGFNARFSAISRVYRYTIYWGSVRMPLLDRYAEYVRDAPEWSEMQAAATTLCGSHDYAAFGQVTSGTSTVRRVDCARWIRGEDVLVPYVGRDWPLAQFEIEANGFLRGMVRRVVAMLLEVGCGGLSSGAFREILASGDISRARAKAPAHGLTLWCVRYREDSCLSHRRSGVAEKLIAAERRRSVEA